VALVVSSGCDRAAEEPEPDTKARAVSSAPQLIWQAPPAWNVERTAERGEYRAKYKIPTAGDSKHEAEVLISYLGKGKSADVAGALTDLLGEFEGPGSSNPTRETFQVGDLEVSMLEVGATYKFPMGPRMGPKKKAPATVIKANWRGIIYGVSSKERGHWLFQMVGPNDTVVAARSSFRAMIEGLR
jgi:hypothetical protein